MACEGGHDLCHGSPRHARPRALLKTRKDQLPSQNTPATALRYPPSPPCFPPPPRPPPALPSACDLVIAAPFRVPPPPRPPPPLPSACDLVIAAPFRRTPRARLPRCIGCLSPCPRSSLYPWPRVSWAAPAPKVRPGLPQPGSATCPTGSSLGSTWISTASYRRNRRPRARPRRQSTATRR